MTEESSVFVIPLRFGNWGGGGQSAGAWSDKTEEDRQEDEAVSCANQDDAEVHPEVEYLRRNEIKMVQYLSI